ncbi:ABC transporter permease [uncultured Ilumatobacter sp.]|jgi:peptide/nickel transport system permease protein|uniref:ABC transporter permease n=1 Tax=uncultured Ilumatobacter sp. TaxID=879968 RepID=UPI00374E62D0
MSSLDINGAETTPVVSATGGADTSAMSFNDATNQANADGAAFKRRLGFGFWVAATWLGIVFAAAVLAPWLPFKDPNVNNIVSGQRPPYAPSGTHLFGTDQDARDMLSRTVFGARVSLTVGLVAIGMGMLFGGFMGIVAGYFRGWWDRVISFIFIIFLSFPALVLAILITALLERSLRTISITLGILAIAPVGRVARATTISFADREFVLAARTLGAKNGRIIVKELLPNVLIPMSALALLGMAVAIVAEGGLAFLGLSVEKGPTWGKVILTGAGSRDLQKAPWIAIIPIIVLFLTVLALNYAGDRIRTYFDARETGL